jgi:hypothetical protein
MKKVCVMALVAGLALTGQATQLDWAIGQPGTWVDGGTPQNGTGWYVGMYDAGSAGAVPGTLPGGAPIGAEVASDAIDGYIGQLGAERLAFNTVTKDVPDSAFVYSVVWNNASQGAATWYLIMDNLPAGQLFDVPPIPEPPGPVDYIGGSGALNGLDGQGAWQQVPEPSAVALFALGLGVLGMVIRRRLARK